MKILSTIPVCAHALLCKVSALRNIICSMVSFSAALSRSDVINDDVVLNRDLKQLLRR